MIFTAARKPFPAGLDDIEEIDALDEEGAADWLAGWERPIVARAQALGLRGGRVLVAGTGAGRVPVALARAIPAVDVTCVGPSALLQQDGLRQARASGLVGRAWFQSGDPARLEAPDHSFDGAVCPFALHRLAQPGRALAELARVLRPGGMLLVVDWARPARWLRGWRLRRHAPQGQPKLRAFFEAGLDSALTASELRALARAAALEGARTFRRGPLLGLEKRMWS